MVQLLCTWKQTEVCCGADVLHGQDPSTLHLFSYLPPSTHEGRSCPVVHVAHHVCSQPCLPRDDSSAGGQQAAKQHSSGIPPASGLDTAGRRDDASGSKRKRMTGATAAASMRDAASRQGDATGIKQRRTVGAAAVPSGARRLPPPAARRLDGRVAPYSTWLTLPEPPATAAKGAAQQEAPAASADAAGASAALRGVAAGGNTPDGARLELPATPAKAKCAALNAPFMGVEGHAHGGSKTAARGGEAVTEQGPRSARLRLPATPAGAADAARLAAPYEMQSRLIAGIRTPERSTAAPRALLGRSHRLSQPAADPALEQGGLRAHDAPCAGAEGREDSIAAVKRNALRSTHLRVPTTAVAGATGDAQQLASHKVENRLIAGIHTVLSGEAEPRALHEDQRLIVQPAGNPRPKRASSESPSAPSQTVAAVTMPVCKGLPQQLRASTSPYSRRKRSAAQQLTNTNVTMMVAYR